MPKQTSHQVAYVHVLGNAPGKRIGIVEYLDSGYYPTDFDDPTFTTDQVDRVVSSINDKLGVTYDVQNAMLAGSMFGWRVPAAKAALAHFGKPEVV